MSAWNQEARHAAFSRLKETCPAADDIFKALRDAICSCECEDRSHILNAVADCEVANKALRDLLRAAQIEAEYERITAEDEYKALKRNWKDET